MRLFTIILCASVMLSCIVTAATHEITSLPYTFDSDDMTGGGEWDTLTIAGTSLSSSGDGITIEGKWGETVHSVVLLLESDTIFFDDDSTGNATGLQIGNGSGGYGVAYNIHVIGGVIKHAVGNGAEIPNIDGVSAENWHSCLIYNTDVIVAGQQNTTNENTAVNGMYLQAGWNNIVRKCDVWNMSTGYRDRVDYPACGIRAQRTFDDSHIQGDTTYHLRIDSTVVHRAPHVGILLYGAENDTTDAYRGVFEVVACSVAVSARNERTDYEGYRVGNPYALQVRNIERLTAHDNKFIRQTDYLGGSGVLLERLNPNTTGDWSSFHDNVIVASAHEDALQCTGLRIRIQTERLTCYDNTITVYGDDDSETDYIGDDANGMMVAYDGYSEDSLIVYGNHTEVIGASGAVATAFSLMCKDSAAYFNFHHNYWESNNKVVVLSSDDDQCDYFDLTGDTLVQGDNPYSFEAITLGVLGMYYPTDGCRFIDLVAINTDDTACTINTAGDEHEAEWFRNFSVVTQLPDASPVNAHVVIVNNYGDTAYNANIGADGCDTVLVKYWRRAYDGSAYDDSTGFNPHSITAWVSADTVDTAMNVGAGGGTVTLTFGDLSMYHQTTVIDTSVSGFVLEMDFAEYTDAVDSCQIFVSTSSPATDWWESITTVTDPDSSTVTGLDDNYLYYYRTIMWDEDEADTVNGSVTTLEDEEEPPPMASKRFRGWKL